MEDTNQPQWRKSTKCGNATCVEVAQVGDQILVRDSKGSPGAPQLSLSRDQWERFAEDIAAGAFRFD